MYENSKTVVERNRVKERKIIFLEIITFDRQIFDIEPIMLGICEQRKSPFLKTGKIKSVLL